MHINKKLFIDRIDKQNKKIDKELSLKTVRQNYIQNQHKLKEYQKKTQSTIQKYQLQKQKYLKKHPQISNKNQNYQNKINSFRLNIGKKNSIYQDKSQHQIQLNQVKKTLNLENSENKHRITSLQKLKHKIQSAIKTHQNYGINKITVKYLNSTSTTLKQPQSIYPFFLQQLKLDAKFLQCKNFIYNNTLKKELYQKYFNDMREQQFSKIFQMEAVQYNPFHKQKQINLSQIRKIWNQAENHWRVGFANLNLTQLSELAEGKGYFGLIDLTRQLNLKLLQSFHLRNYFKIFKRLSQNSPICTNNQLNIFNYTN